MSVSVRTFRKKGNFIIDVKTRNISFLQTAKDLKVLGIKNWSFFLALYDERLQGIDPHDIEKITPEIALAIANECMINPYYFLREVSRIPDQGGKGIPYQLNRGNLAATFCFLNNISHYLVLPRQIGKTQSEIANALWAFLFGATYSEFGFTNKSQEDANKNIERLKTQRSLLPEYLRLEEIAEGDGKISKGLNNMKKISNPINYNSIVAFPKATTKEAGEQIGRGLTQPILLHDEVEFTSNIQHIILSAGPAYRQAAQNARRNNSAHCRMFLTTPGDLDTEACQQALEYIVSKTCKWSESFYDMDINKVRELIRKKSDNDVVYIEYQYYQLGKDEDWFIEACRAVGNDPVAIKREILLQRRRGSDQSPFTPEQQAIIDENRGKVVQEIFINEIHNIDLYEELNPDKIYFIGVDCARGLGMDNTAVTILDPYSLKPVGEFKCPYISALDTEKFLVSLVKKYIPKSIVIVERNDQGITLLELLKQSKIRFNIYFDDTLTVKVDERYDNKGFLRRESMNRRAYGVETNTKTRGIMLSILEAHVNHHPEDFVGNNIINDLLSLVRKKNGKIEHSTGFHDDSLFSYLMTLFVYYHGKNLARYGFVKGELPSEENRNKGLRESINELLSEEDRAFFSGVTIKTEEDYEKERMREMAEVRRISDEFNQLFPSSEGAENFDKDAEYKISSDFFDYLNS